MSLDFRLKSLQVSKRISRDGQIHCYRLRSIWIPHVIQEITGAIFSHRLFGSVLIKDEPWATVTERSIAGEFEVHVTGGAIKIHEPIMPRVD